MTELVVVKKNRKFLTHAPTEISTFSLSKNHSGRK